MPHSILLIDDDADVRATFREFLTREGYVVHTAQDGQHALAVLEKISRPDLILLDYRMPIMNGRQFLGEMRQKPAWRNIPVVVLSAWTREWSGAILEVADVLYKPVDLELLLSTVDRVSGAPVAADARSRRKID